MEFDKSLAIVLIFLFASMTLILPLLLEPTKILPLSLSAICLGESILSTNISIENPSSIFR